MSTDSQQRQDGTEQSINSIEDLSEGEFQVAGTIPESQYERLKTSLERHGFEPSRGHITVDENGTIIDGHHRVAGCKDLNIEIPETAIDVRSGLSWLEKRSLARRLNSETKGRPITKQLKKDLIRQAISDYDERGEQVSNTEVADECGASANYTSEIRVKMMEDGGILDTSNFPMRHKRDKIRERLRSDASHDLSALADEFALDRGTIRNIEQELVEEQREEKREQDREQDSSGSSEAGESADTTDTSADTDTTDETSDSSEPSGPSDSDGSGTDGEPETGDGSTADRNTESDEFDSSSAQTDVEQERQQLEERMDGIRDAFREIKNDPDVQHRSDLRDSMLAHMAVSVVFDELSCPDCGADADELTWTCCDLDADEAVKRAKQQYQESVDSVEEDQTHGVMADV